MPRPHRVPPEPPLPVGTRYHSRVVRITNGSAARARARSWLPRTAPAVRLQLRCSGWVLLIWLVSSIVHPSCAAMAAEVMCPTSNDVSLPLALLIGRPHRAHAKTLPRPCSACQYLRARDHDA